MTERDLEAPEEDAAEQQADVRPGDDEETDGGTAPDRERDAADREADPADIAEQERPVGGEEEDEYR